MRYELSDFEWTQYLESQIGIAAHPSRRPLRGLLRMRSNLLKHNNLMLRSERRERLEAWAAGDSPISHSQHWHAPRAEAASFLRPFFPDHREMDDGLHGLFHVLHADPFQPRMERVFPGENIGAGQPHERQPRAVGAAADRGLHRLEAGTAGRFPWIFDYLGVGGGHLLFVS